MLRIHDAYLHIYFRCLSGHTWLKNLRLSGKPAYYRRQKIQSGSCTRVQLSYHAVQEKDFAAQSASSQQDPGAQSAILALPVSLCLCHCVYVQLQQ